MFGYPIGYPMRWQVRARAGRKNLLEPTENGNFSKGVFVFDGPRRLVAGVGKDHKWTILDSNTIQNPKENELFRPTGYYSGDYPELAGTDELLAIWEKMDDPARRDLLAVARGLAQAVTERSR